MSWNELKWAQMNPKELKRAWMSLNELGSPLHEGEEPHLSPSPPKLQHILEGVPIACLSPMGMIPANDGWI